MGLRVLPALPQTAPAQQCRPQQFTQPWKVRMWCQPAVARGKAHQRPPSGGRHGQSWGENHGLSQDSSRFWSDTPHEGNLTCSPWEHWGCHWDGGISEVQNAIGASFCLWHCHEMWDSSLFGARKLADNHCANFSCLPPPRVTTRYARPCCFSITLLLSMQLSSQLPHPLFYSNLVVSAQQWQSSWFCFALSNFYPEHKLPQTTVSPFLLFLSPAKTGYVATREYSTSIWRSTSCHKGNNCGHKAAPKTPVQHSVSDQQSI